jgi:regulatory protein
MPCTELDDELATAVDVKPADIRLAAMNLLARREHSVRELHTKLKKRFADEKLVVFEVQRLTGENLQSDQRFAQAYARQRANGGFGPVRVRHEMHERGLSDLEVSEAFEFQELDWHALAAVAYSKKYGQSSGREALELKELARRTRFMQYRGFTAEHFQHLLRE